MTFGNPETSQPIISEALNLGISPFDTANIYHGGRSEEGLGETVKENRDDVILCTKVFYPTAQNALSQGLTRHRVKAEYIVADSADSEVNSVT